MSAIDEQTSRLHALHDAYVWRVNAAIAAGRPELARELADEYTDEALELLAYGCAAAPAAGLGAAVPRGRAADRGRIGWLGRMFGHR